MKAIILAAGEGTRLRPYTDDRPKCLVSVDGVSLLQRQLNVLQARGIEDITVVGGYHAEALQTWPVSLRLNPEYASTNMVYTLFCAADELEGDVLVCYGDIVYSSAALSDLLACQAPIATTIDMRWESYWRARSDNPLADAETLKLSPEGRILEIGAKPKSLEEIEGQYMGLIKFNVEGIRALKAVFAAANARDQLGGKPVRRAYMTDLLQRLIDEGYPIQSVPVVTDWVEVDTVADLHSALTRNRLATIAATI